MVISIQFHHCFHPTFIFIWHMSSNLLSLNQSFHLIVDLRSDFNSLQRFLGLQPRHAHCHLGHHGRVAEHFVTHGLDHRAVLLLGWRDVGADELARHVVWIPI